MSGPLFCSRHHPWEHDVRLLTTFRSIQREALERYYHVSSEDYGSVTSDLSDGFSDIVAEDLVHEDAHEPSAPTRDEEAREEIPDDDLEVEEDGEEEDIEDDEVDDHEHVEKTQDDEEEDEEDDMEDERDDTDVDL